MISHRNVIANTLQITAFESNHRESLKTVCNAFTDIALGLLPQSHIYGLVVICHAGPYRGDQTIILPKFNLSQYLSAVQEFNIRTLFLVSVYYRLGIYADYCCYRFPLLLS
jgi:acyl-CoA synthetase (AMP-forming)/AMP-acid ligase II